MTDVYLFYIRTEGGSYYVKNQIDGLPGDNQACFISLNLSIRALRLYTKTGVPTLHAILSKSTSSQNNRFLLNLKSRIRFWDLSFY